MQKFSHRLPCKIFKQKLLICSFLADITAVPVGFFGSIAVSQ